ncbi:MAG TPA: hypothetical protein VF613_01995 [Longimicrobium sp.]|jgi:hypothetical protein
MRYVRLSIAALALASAAACSDGANPAATMQPAAPRFDGGGMVGSGNRNDTTPTQVTSAAAATDTTGAVGRGGGMVGSGN